MPIALITGSTGLIGSESSLFFLNKGFEVVGIDNNLRKTFFGKDGDTSWIKNTLIKNKNYKHYNCDI
ncbi:NAD-dependent epimerase, partial [bacterium]|nr:NAD-dependent epimerase [bacterium]